MNNHRYTFIGIIFATTFWLIDSSLHFLLYEEKTFEFIPSEFNELWMRTAIFVMVIALGTYADYHTKKIIQKELEKSKIFFATIHATHHILHNFLNKMQLFRIAAEKSSDFDKDILLLHDHVIQDTITQIKRLESIADITEQDINDSLFPMQ